MELSAAANSVWVGIDRATAVRFVVLIGAVSLFADMTYEGARSVTGPFLATLGASATVVGVAAGFGELAGYGIRLVSGYVGDRSGRYWTMVLAGYVLNLLVVPLLALATSWPVAVTLLVTERIGRGLRTPTRDAMLSHAASHTGAGWAFGMHEALDTTGAILGPLVVSAALYLGLGYKAGFATLVVPALISISLLLAARARFANPRDLDVAQPIQYPGALSRRFWVFSIAAAVIGAGYADFSLLAYHFGKTAVVAAPWIPVLYAAAMLAAAAAALALGRLFDRAGMIAMIPATLVSAAAAPLAFLGGPTVLSLGVICWGIGMGMQESVMRAAVAAMAPQARRGTAFGLFHAIFGVAWFAGSALLGFVYDHSILATAIISLALQLLAVPILLALARKPTPPAGPGSP